MTEWADMSIMLVAMTNLAIVGTSRLRLCIRIVALQGTLLGALAVLAHTSHLSYHVFLLAVMGIALKGLVFPRLLFRTLQQTDVRHEMDPIVGHTASILIGIAMLAAALGLSARLPMQDLDVSPLVVPISLWTISVGLFMIVARRKAVSQVLGYLVLENGIFAFGVALVGGMPFLVEMGGLLDVFMAVFVMGIAIFHISREFEHTDTDKMSVLTD